MATAAAPPAAPGERVLVVANDYPGQDWALREVAAEADAYERILTEAGIAFQTLRNCTAAQFRIALGAQRPATVIFCGHGNLELQHGGGMALCARIYRIYTAYVISFLFMFFFTFTNSIVIIRCRFCLSTNVKTLETTHKSDKLQTSQTFSENWDPAFPTGRFIARPSCTNFLTASESSMG